MKLLDHGYLKLIETWGSDQAIIESARMSTDKGFLGWGPNVCAACDGRGRGTAENPGEFGDPPCKVCKGDGRVPGDEKLLRFLYEKKHSTPFEFAGLTVEVQAPLIVFREWHRHRVPFGYSELSARYTPMPDDNYLPTVERCMMAGGPNRQASAASGAAELTVAATEIWLRDLSDLYEHAERVYQKGLQCGIPKELARLPVPVGRYSRMRATGNLRGWLAFLTLRMAPDAQFEIRQFANSVGALVHETFPRTWKLFEEGRSK